MQSNNLFEPGFKYTWGSVLRCQKWIIVVINVFFCSWWSHRMMNVVSSLYFGDVGVRREKRRCLRVFFCFIYTLPWGVVVHFSWFFIFYFLWRVFEWSGLFCGNISVTQGTWQQMLKEPRAPDTVKWDIPEVNSWDDNALWSTQLREKIRKTSKNCFFQLSDGGIQSLQEQPQFTVSSCVLQDLNCHMMEATKRVFKGNKEESKWFDWKRSWAGSYIPSVDARKSRLAADIYCRVAQHYGNAGKTPKQTNLLHQDMWNLV